MRHPIVHLVLLLALAGCATTGTNARQPLTEAQRAGNLESFQLAWETVRDRHWDANLGGFDWDAVYDEIKPKVEAAKTQKEYTAAVQGMISRFEQSHFSIVPSEVYEEMSGGGGEDAEGSPGFDLRVVDGRALVTRVEPESSAAKQGIQTGWILTHVQGKSLRPMLAEIRQTFEGKTMLELIQGEAVLGKLSGSVGETLGLRFRDGGDRKTDVDVALVKPRGTKHQLGVFPPNFVYIEHRVLPANIGYVTFNMFMDPVNVMKGFEEAMRSFRDCRGIVIDIRGNPGGMPAMAMGMAGFLVDRKDLAFGTMKMRDSDLNFVVNPRPRPYTGPVAMLIDGTSASASEIFAGGLRDMKRARLFGARTAGAVLPAQFMELPNGDFFYYPIADYISMNGDRLEGVGVAPDTEARPDRAALLEGRDTALNAAIAWIVGEHKATASPNGD